MLETLADMASSLCLHQIVEKPTHKDGNILDLVFVYNRDLLFHYSVDPVPRSISPRDMIVVETVYKAQPATLDSDEIPKRSVFDLLNFQSPDIQWNLILTKLLEIDWQSEFRGKSPD